MAAVDPKQFAPITVNSTVIPFQRIGFGPGVSETPIRHTGNLFDSNLVRGAINPVVTATVPFKEAYDLIGFGILKVTTLTIRLATFANLSKQSGLNHIAYSFASSASAAAQITGLREGTGGVIMAEVTFTLLSADGTTHPLARSTSQSLASLASEPSLYVRGPLELNGTRYSGVRSLSGSTGNRLIVPAGIDGDTYPRQATYDGGQAVLQVGHGDPDAILAALGFDGAAITANAVQYLRAVGSDYLTTAATGLSITVASGSIVSGQVSGGVGSRTSGGIIIRALSSTDTHPWAVNASATLPAA